MHPDDCPVCSNVKTGLPHLIVTGYNSYPMVSSPEYTSIGVTYNFIFGVYRVSICEHVIIMVGPEHRISIIVVDVNTGLTHSL